MRRLAVFLGVAVLSAGLALAAVRFGMVVQARRGGQVDAAVSGKVPNPAGLDALLAPIALYPDQLLAQMLLCATDPGSVKALHLFLQSHSALKGTDLQDAVLQDNFEPSFVALALFPQIVSQMASELESTTRLGQAFAADRNAVFASIQRLRTQAQQAGTLKTTTQQDVETRTTSSGQQVIVIEPANPQVVYVPQYNPQTVYVQPATVVVEQNSTDAAVAGLIGFTAGIAIGAAINNDYYYGPYGWHGGGYMYNDAWDDYYDHREDARDDWQDHREDLVDERGDRARTQQEQRTERTETRQENRPDTQQQRNQPSRTASSTYEARGNSSSDRATQQRSGTGSDAFSGYSSGKSERAASARGQTSRGGSRSRSGGGGRRR